MTEVVKVRNTAWLVELAQTAKKVELAKSKMVQVHTDDNSGKGDKHDINGRATLGSKDGKDRKKDSTSAQMAQNT